jgi:anti-sigma factor RsiW
VPHSDDGGTLGREAWDLIPWVANGSASREERERVEQHVRHCPDCADELAAQRRLQQEIAREPEQVGAPESALHALLERIDDDTQAPVPRHRSPPRLRWHRWVVPGLVGAVLVEACAVALLVGLTWVEAPRGLPTTGFRTLTSATPATGPASLRVVFAGDLRMDQIQRLLTPLHLQIIGGPSAAGALTLASEGAGTVSTAATLKALRADPGVRFAEPVDSAP